MGVPEALNRNHSCSDGTSAEENLEGTPESGVLWALLSWGLGILCAGEQVSEDINPRDGALSGELDVGRCSKDQANLIERLIEEDPNLGDPFLRER